MSVSFSGYIVGNTSLAGLLLLTNLLILSEHDAVRQGHRDL